MDQFSHDSLNAASAEDISAANSRGRDSLLLTAQFRLAETPRDEAITVRVRNLSAGGLMAEHAEPLPMGTPVEIDVRGIGWVAGKIAWSAEGRVGVAFDRQIDPMLARKPVGKGAQTPAFAKAIVTRR